MSLFRTLVFGACALLSTVCADSKYIRGGSLSGGDGTLEHPYSSFQEAEAANWTVLKVLASETPIYGGIALKDGQSIEGESRRECVFASLDGSVHNGDVIVASGNNTISGITIQTAFRCGIEALDAENLTIENCSINRCNTSGEELAFDYHPSTIERDFGEWAAISFFGGKSVTSGIQPFNKKSGKFTLTDSRFSGNARDILVGSGDSEAQGFVSDTFNREYDISNCEFTNTRHSRSIQLLVYGGGVLSGAINDCTFENVKSSDAIAIMQINANNPNFPGRGNYSMGTNEITNCYFKNVYRSGVYFEAAGNLTSSDAKVVIKDNLFIDCAKHYRIDTPIQTLTENSASGEAWQWVVEDNLIAHT